jgi:hypothetical protein
MTKPKNELTIIKTGQQRNIWSNVPLLAVIIFIFGAVTLGIWQLVEQVSESTADYDNSLPYDISGDSDWCSSSLRALLNSDEYLTSLDASTSSFTPTSDCGGVLVSLLSAKTWDEAKNVYFSALGNDSYLPDGVDAVWTTTAESDKVYSIDSSGELALLPPDTPVGVAALPSVNLAKKDACVISGTGTTSDPYVLAEDNACESASPPTPTPTPTPNLNCNIANCSFCFSNNVCASCNTDYSLNNKNQCIAICQVDHCQSCSTPNYCAVCAAGYYLRDGGCERSSKVDPTPTPTARPSYRPDDGTPTPHPDTTATPTAVLSGGSGNESGIAMGGLLSGMGIGRHSPSAPDLTNLLKAMGASVGVVEAIEFLFARIFPIFSLLVFIPLGILIWFFPRPGGLVLDSITGMPVARALVMILREGRFVRAAITNKCGYYTGFKLPPGEYQLHVTAAGHCFPSRRQSPFFYQETSFKIKSASDKAWAKSLLLDRLEDTQVAPVVEEMARGKQRNFSLILKILNGLVNFWNLAFILVIVSVLVYITMFNLLVLGIYFVGATKRILTDKQPLNVTGTLLTPSQEPHAQVLLQVFDAASRQLVGTTVTDDNGAFSWLLKPDEQYLLAAPGHVFLQADGSKNEITNFSLPSSPIKLSLVAEVDN